MEEPSPPASHSSSAKPPRSTDPGPARTATASAKKLTLRPGDTLYALAEAHGTSVKVLQELNDLGTSTLIYAGDTLRVPADPYPTQPQMGPAGADRPETDPPKNDPPKPDPPKKETPKEAPKSGAKAVVAFARDQLGKPYVWGGTGPRGYDCSGLVMRAWEKADVELPRTTWDQAKAGKTTTRGKLVPGDLIISNNGGHVQLYIGDGQVIHAPGHGRQVTTAPLPDRSDVVSYRHITP
ncbi:C40 family peptidase [Streptomyces sp. GMY02]|uniref:C40 family peptidase n=1 Tax=Streptomyces sp. GMY02 TaxID=1333528 RepID=UPI001C2BC06F|nr:C40 family peptidase [Streptomyces sp. GMY02]QXE38054.1 C40 family peptidase [Streptomyces sp. GMY02]